MTDLSDDEILRRAEAITTCRVSERRRLQWLEYSRRPEVKARREEVRKRPEVRARRKEVRGLLKRKKKIATGLRRGIWLEGHDARLRAAEADGETYD